MGDDPPLDTVHARHVEPGNAIMSHEPDNQRSPMSRRRMTELSPTQDPHAGQSTQAVPSAHRKVAVHGSGGVSATIVVIARQGRVWLSVIPPLTWEAILEPIQVDELTHALELAREDATKMAAASKNGVSLDRAVIREITGKRS